MSVSPSSHRSLPLCLAATALLALPACGSDDDDDDGCGDGTPAACPDARVFVLSTDLSSTGGYATIDAERRACAGPDLVHSDAIVRVDEGLVYVVNRRGENNVQVLDPAEGFATVRQFTTGQDSNPQDIAVVAPDRAYSPLYDASQSPHILRFDPVTGQPQGGIDLSEWADDDGFPEASSVLQVGDSLLVAVQRIDRSTWKADNTSYLLRIDLATEQVVDALPLARPNPFNLLELAPDGRTVLIASTGTFSSLGDTAGQTDGALEAVDVESWTSRVIAYGTDLGADVTTAAYDGDRLFVVLESAMETGFSTDVVELDPDTGERLGTVFSPGAFVVWDIRLEDTGALWVTDRTPGVSGIHVYEDSDPAQESFIPFEPCLLPPYQIRFLD